MRITVSMAAPRKAAEKEPSHPENAGSPQLRLSSTVTPIQTATKTARLSGMSIQSGVFVLTIESFSTSCSSRPGNRQQEGALFKCMDVVRDAAVEREQPARAKAEGPPRGP